MKFINVDPILEKIYKMEKIESISIKDLVQGNDGINYVLPMILVTYDGNKSICLCSKDKYFDIFVKKLTEVYNQEKENVYIDNITDPFRLRNTIMIDEHSKQILESNKLLEINSFYDNYKDLIAYKESLLFENDEVKTLMPIVLYHLKRFLSFTDITYTFNDELKGYKMRYALDGTINGISKYFPFLYKKVSDNHYSLSIKGILDYDLLYIEIIYKANEIIVKLYNDSIDLHVEFNYKVNEDKVIKIEDFVRRNITIHYLKEELKSISNPKEFIMIDLDESYQYYKLPWNGLFGIKTLKFNISDDEIRRETAIIIADQGDKVFSKRESYLKTYQRSTTPTRKGEVVVLEDAELVTLGFELDNNENVYVIETKFIDTDKQSGYYLTNYKDQYFYKLIYKEKSINLTKDDIHDKSELYNRVLVKQIVGGE